MASDLFTQFIRLTKLPWDICLVQLLENQSWELFNNEFGIIDVDYSTTMFVCQDSSKQINQFEKRMYINTSDRPILLDALPMPVMRHFEENGLTVLNPDGISEWSLLCMEQAINKYIACVPSLYQSVQSFVHCLHVLEAGDDAYDVSHSDPEIPFSIFVSVSNRQENKSVWRVAESIVHETMHLQLTLLERFIPLIRSDHSGEKYYSPWKGSKREARGILHAVYVFAVIRQYWKAVLEAKAEKGMIDFASKRIADIEAELLAIRDFAYSEDLTQEGRIFVHALLVL